MEINFKNADNCITDQLIKDIYADIELSKKIIFDFKLSCLNNNIINNKLDIIAIKKLILLNLFESFERITNNIEQKIKKLRDEINCILKNNDKNFFFLYINNNSMNIIYKNNLPQYIYYILEN